jgi:flagellar biosynthesis chaperone FliJ
MATKKVKLTPKEKDWKLISDNLEALDNYAELLLDLNSKLQEYTLYNADELTVAETKEMQKLITQFDKAITKKNADFSLEDMHDDLDNLEYEIRGKKPELELWAH